MAALTYRSARPPDHITVAAARAGQRGGVMRLAIASGLRLPPRLRPHAASNLMCQGGHHAACSIARTFTTLDRPVRPSVAGGPDRVRGSAGPACAGGVVVAAGPAAGGVRQFGGAETSRGQHR